MVFLLECYFQSSIPLLKGFTIKILQNIFFNKCISIYHTQVTLCYFYIVFSWNHSNDPHKSVMNLFYIKPWCTLILITRICSMNQITTEILWRKKCLNVDIITNLFQLSISSLTLFRKLIKTTVEDNWHKRDMFNFYTAKTYFLI